MKTEQDIADACSLDELTAIYEAWIAEKPYRKDYGCAMETWAAVLHGVLPGDAYDLRWLEVFCIRWDEVSPR